MKTIAVDANPILPALLGGKALEILSNKAFCFIITERIIWEVKKYIPELAGNLEVDDTDLYYALENLPILTIQARFYDEQTELAERLIAHRDSKDVDLLALSLAIDAPIWTQDKDIEGIGQITLLKTSDMVKIV